VLPAAVNICLKRHGGAANALGPRGFVACFALIASIAFSPAAMGQGPSEQNDIIAEASTARMQNDVPRAIELYSKAVAQNPKWPDGWWFLGSLQYGVGDYAPARDALSHYVEMIPTAGPAFALRGLCEFETGDYSQALTDIQHGISLGAANQPRNEQILRYHEALLLTRLGNYSAAVKTYEFFAKDGVTNPELLAALGLAGLRMPLLPKDVSKEQQELVLAAGSAAYKFMAGDESSSERAFEDLFQRFPTAPNAHFLYGYLLFATDPYEALTEFQQELKIVPSNANADVMASWALLLQNRTAEALPYAEQAVAAEPKLPSAQLVLGKSLIETGDTKRGLEHLETALQLEPNNLETHLALAKAYSKSGRNEEARRERLLCLQLTSSNGTTTANP
jgi:tetratricopeptide (TPR) repeat protein